MYIVNSNIGQHIPKNRPILIYDIIVYINLKSTAV